MTVGHGGLSYRNCVICKHSIHPANSGREDIENRCEDDSDDVLHFVVQSEASSVGSRSSGRLARAKIENLMAMYPNYPVNIDFGDISVVSSGFADEFLGKLFVRMGRSAS